MRHFLQARTQEYYDILGVLPKIKEEGEYVPPTRIYELPGGIKPLKTYSGSPWVDPTPGIPYVWQFCLNVFERAFTASPGQLANGFPRTARGDSTRVPA